MQSIDSIETYAHGRSKALVYKKEEIKCCKVKKTLQKCFTLNILQKKA